MGKTVLAFFPAQVVRLVLVITVIGSNASAHPGAGIVVDRQGQIYFVDTGVNTNLGVWKIDTQGRLTRHPGPHYHFMAIDHQGRLAGAQLPSGVEAVGTNPTLILSGGFPVTVGSDGALYYPQPGDQDHVQIMRLVASKSPTVLATLPIATEVAPDGKQINAQWIHGLASGPENSLYYSEQRAVRRIGPDGVVSLVAGEVKVPDCVRPLGANDERFGPSLRGLDVKPDGTVVVAASACSAVLGITPKGAAKVVLPASDSWSPTGIAVSGDDLYVLEYLLTDSHQREDWLPRVRKISRDGNVTVVATVTKELRRTTESAGTRVP